MSSSPKRIPLLALLLGIAALSVFIGFGETFVTAKWISARAASSGIGTAALAGYMLGWFFIRNYPELRRFKLFIAITTLASMFGWATYLTFFFG